MDYSIRIASMEDAGIILQFIKELAVYEKLGHEVVAQEEDIRKTIFDGSGRSFAMIAECEGKAVGFALCFYNYSTFQGRYGIYIEDLYVAPAYRGRGIGKGFFKAIAQKALDEKCGRIQWWVLDWNEPAIEFYKSVKAQPMDEWTVFRLEGDDIRLLAG